MFGVSLVRILVERKSLRSWALPVAAALLLAGCARPDTSQPAGKLSDVFATPDWAKFAAAKPTARREITSNDLLTADGRCAFTAETASASTDAAVASAPDTTAEALASSGPLPTLPGGVALSMTECQVVQRTGSPERFDIGAEGGERVLTMTVTQGPSPGLYRFRGGRLVSIERIELPPAAKPVRAAKSKKKAAPGSVQQSAAPLRGTQR